VEPQIVALSKELEAKDQKLRDWQSRYDKLSASHEAEKTAHAATNSDAQVKALNERLATISIGAFGNPPEMVAPTTFAECLKVCAGNYKEARKRFAEVWEAEYGEKRPKKAKKS
jgi:hypothetical protein